MPGTSAVTRSASSSSTTSMRGSKILGLKSPNQRSTLPLPTGSSSSSCIMRNGSATSSRGEVNHAEGKLAVAAIPGEEAGSARFSSGVLRRNLNGFHLLTSVFMSVSLAVVHSGKIPNVFWPACPGPDAERERKQQSPSEDCVEADQPHERERSRAGKHEDERAEDDRSNPRQHQQPFSAHDLPQADGDGNIQHARDQRIRAHYQHQRQRRDTGIKNGNPPRTDADQAEQQNQPPTLVAVAILHGADNCDRATENG